VGGLRDRRDCLATYSSHPLIERLLSSGRLPRLHAAH
jgi:hypothetical protein